MFHLVLGYSVLNLFFELFSKSGPTPVQRRWASDEKIPITQITRSSYRQISTIAGDFIGMMGFPSGRTRICMVPGAGY